MERNQNHVDLIELVYGEGRTLTAEEAMRYLTDYSWKSEGKGWLYGVGGDSIADIKYQHILGRAIANPLYCEPLPLQPRQHLVDAIVSEFSEAEIDRRVTLEDGSEKLVERFAPGMYLQLNKDFFTDKSNYLPSVDFCLTSKNLIGLQDINYTIHTQFLATHKNKKFTYMIDDFDHAPITFNFTFKKGVEIIQS